MFKYSYVLEPYYPYLGSLSRGSGRLIFTVLSLQRSGAGSTAVRSTRCLSSTARSRITALLKTIPRNNTSVSEIRTVDMLQTNIRGGV